MTTIPQAPSLTYSSSGADNLSLFHRVKHVIYVEGPDDVPFWKYIFRELKFPSFIVKPAGGSEEIDKYTREILDADSNIVVCRDQDYLTFEYTIIDHPRIIYTYGNAIENSLYCAESIAGLIADYTRSADVDIDAVANWQVSIANELLELLILDVARYLYKNSMATILPDNCMIYLEDRKAVIVSNRKISAYREKISKQFSEEQLTEAKRRIFQDSRAHWYKFRGHFLTHAVLKYIKYRIDRAGCGTETISKSNLFVELVRRFTLDCWNGVDAEFIRSQTSRLADDQD